MAAMRTDLLSGRGSALYEAATSPRTSSAVQRPVMVARTSMASCARRFSAAPARPAVMVGCR